MGAFISLVGLPPSNSNCPLLCSCRAVNPTSVTSGLQVWEATTSHPRGATAFRPIPITDQPTLNACAVYILLSVSAVCPYCDHAYNRNQRTTSSSTVDPFLDRLLAHTRSIITNESIRSSISSGLAETNILVAGPIKLSYEIHVWEGKAAAPEVRSVALSVATTLASALDTQFIIKNHLDNTPLQLHQVANQLAIITRPLLPQNHNWLLLHPLRGNKPVSTTGDNVPALIQSYCASIRPRSPPFISSSRFPPGPRGPPVICRLLPRIETTRMAAISPRTMSAALSETSAAVSALAISPRGIARPSPLADQVLLQRYPPDLGLRSTIAAGGTTAEEAGSSSDRSSNSSSCGNNGWGARVVHRVVLQKVVPPLAIGNLVNRSSSQGDNAPMPAPRWRDPPSSPRSEDDPMIGRTLSSIARFGSSSSPKNYNESVESVNEEIMISQEVETLPVTDVDLRVWRLARWTAALAEKRPHTEEEDDTSTEVQEKKAAQILQQFATVCTEVVPGCRLYVSGMTVASSKELLRNHGITHIFNLAADTCKNYFPNDYSYSTVVLEDSRYSNEEIQAVLCDLLEHIHLTLISSPTNKVLVHCREGVSRSASVVLAYMMWKARLPFDTCLAALRYTRPISNPNTGFTFALLRFQKLLKVDRLVPGTSYFDQEFQRETDYLPQGLIELDPAVYIDEGDKGESSRKLIEQAFVKALIELGIAADSTIPDLIELPTNVERRIHRLQLHNTTKAPFLIALGLAYLDPGHTAQWLPSLPTPLFDPRFCYVIRVGTLVWLWVGNDTLHATFQVQQFVKHYLRQYCRFASISPSTLNPYLVFQGNEPPCLWQALGFTDLENVVGNDPRIEPLPSTGRIFNYWAYVDSFSTRATTTFDA